LPEARLAGATARVDRSRAIDMASGRARGRVSPQRDGDRHAAQRRGRKSVMTGRAVISHDVFCRSGTVADLNPITARSCLRSCDRAPVRRLCRGGGLGLSGRDRCSSPRPRVLSKPAKTSGLASDDPRQDLCSDRSRTAV
jgi:hypothetical protein